MTDLRAALAEARALAADWRQQERFDAALDRVVEWRYADDRSAPHRPEPWYAERERRDGRWRDAPTEGSGSALRVGFDAAGRPLTADRVRGDRSDLLFEVWEHRDDCWVVFERHEAGVSLLFGAPDRVELRVSASRGGGEVEVERIAWEGGVAVRGDQASAGAGGWPSSMAWRAEVDGEGRLVRMLRGVTPGDYRDDNRLERDEVDDALLAALDAAEAIDPDNPVWEARFHAFETQLRPTDELVAVLTNGLAEAVVGAVVDAAVDEPFVVDVRPGGEDDDRRGVLPGFVWIGSRAFRDEVRASSSSDGDAVRQLWEGQEAGLVTQRHLRDFCSDATLAACREVNAALDSSRAHDDPDKARARAALEPVGEALAEKLNREVVVGNAAERFLVLVRHGDPYAASDPYARATAVVGAEAVEAFRASLRSSVAAVPAGDVGRAQRDRGALETWLRGRGLGDDAYRLANVVARRGFRLRPGEGRNSRLGGPGLLPPGVDWPVTASGRPLTFLAGLDLSEVPADELPSTGWLLFFCDLDGEDPEFFGEPTPNAEGEPARVLFAEAPVAAASAAAEHPARAVMPVEQFVLPDDLDAPRRLGLGRAAGRAYGEVATQLRYGAEGWSEEDDHWVLAGVSGVQSYAPEHDVQLLFLGWDEEVGLTFADGGAIWFSIPADALAARDWSQVCTEADSG